MPNKSVADKGMGFRDREVVEFELARDNRPDFMPFDCEAGGNSRAKYVFPLTDKFLYLAGFMVALNAATA
jgi:hypothetical protein